MIQLVTPIVEHLERHRDQLGIKGVKGIADLMGAMDAMPAAPMLFVVRGAGTARNSSSSTYMVRQDGLQMFDVLSGFTKSLLAGTLDLVDELAQRIDDLIIGWQHPKADAPCEARSNGYARVDWQKGLLFFRQSYAFTHTIERQ